MDWVERPEHVDYLSWVRFRLSWLELKTRVTPFQSITALLSMTSKCGSVWWWTCKIPNRRTTPAPTDLNPYGCLPQTTSEGHPSIYSCVRRSVSGQLVGLKEAIDGHIYIYTFSGSDYNYTSVQDCRCNVSHFQKQEYLALTIHHRIDITMLSCPHERVAFLGEVALPLTNGKSREWKERWIPCDGRRV